MTIQIGPNSRRPKKITVRFSSKLKSEMQQAVIEAGYGLHGKSRWLKEAIATFNHDENHLDYVEQGVSVNQAELRAVEAFYIDADTLETLRSLSLAARTKIPMIEGVQSAVVRAVVVYRLMLK